MPTLDCFDCGQTVEGADIAGLAEAFVVHAHAEHTWPFPDQGIRNFVEATFRLTGPAERLDRVGEIAVHPVTEDRLDDWAAFFDHDAFVGTPQWAACYCLEPHNYDPAVGEPHDVPHWSVNRDAMLQRLRTGGTVGYLAYVDGRAAGWVNASMRSDYALFREGEASDADVIGVSCFIIAPPYRRHGLAAALLDRVIADAPARGATAIEGYPFNGSPEGDAKNFRGPRSLYDERGFEIVAQGERHMTLRRAV